MFNLKEVNSFIEYDGIIKEILHIIKFDGDRNLARKLAELLANNIKTDFEKEKIDYFLSVPIHAKRLKKRGFNQVDVLFSSYLVKNNLVLTPLVTRIKHTPPLFELDKVQRKAVLNKAFELNINYDVKNKNIVIFDDILTSGATLEEMALLLKENGAGTVFGVTMSYVR